MKGLIFIPDISGFTNFVKTIDMDLGMAITKDLLSEIIEHNPLHMQLSEIEGDAVLFYRLGAPTSLQQIIDCFEYMFAGFDTRLQTWKKQYNLRLDLSLKLIVHYGDLLVYDIKGFKKLYGEVVIESHRLLKSVRTVSNYILFTQDYKTALKEDIGKVLSLNSQYVSHKACLRSDQKKVVYYFISSQKPPTIQQEQLVSHIKEYQLAVGN